MKIPTISDDPQVQSRYEEMRRNGESHNMAEMCAMRSACGSRGTERAIFSRVTGNGLDGLGVAQREWKLQQARKAGINPHGKIYMPELARHGVPNDPIAWVGDTHDIVKACHITGRGCPELGVKPAQYMKREQPVALAEKNVKELMVKELESMDPREAKRVNKRELREKIIDKHGAKNVENL